MLLNRDTPSTHESVHAALATGADMAQCYTAVRRATETLCRLLLPDDYGLQAMPDVSPPKWHLAHTTWFFETFVLRPFVRAYKDFDPQFEVLFNSYYNHIGVQYPRAQRALLSRPTVEQVYEYRAYVDKAMMALLTGRERHESTEIERRTTLGCHHEEQHQELLLTDIKYSFSLNPLRPAYCEDLPIATAEIGAALEWITGVKGSHDIGHDGGGFAFDNESPRHQVLLPAHALASRLVTNGEYLEFMRAGGYARPEYWLADGWRHAQAQQWQAPLYWEQTEGRWSLFTLDGRRPLNEYEPVCHVSYYEADAYARWAGARLPSEAEWEAAASEHPVHGNLRESAYLHPVPAGTVAGSEQFYGDTWEWTMSAYSPYPGFRSAAGAIGEYNGKFMVNQMVLRGGSCVTPAAHIRASYRNFFYPADRWQFSGIRLAKDL
jgi:ergothioneine biosynthesis protein EgtB